MNVVAVADVRNLAQRPKQASRATPNLRMPSKVMNSTPLSSESPASDVAVALQDVCKSYVLGDESIDAVHGVSLEMTKGERVAILGKSGCGKSTLMNLLGGLDRPTSGQILIDGREMGELSARQLAKYRRHDVGMVYQSFNLIANKTALQNVELPLIFSGMPSRERRDKAIQMLEAVDLANRMKHRPAELSGGQQQRVAIARALVQRPTLLLADEPCGNLDSATAEQITELIQSISESCGASTMLVTHDREMAERFADRVITMHDGKFEGQE